MWTVPAVAGAVGAWRGPRRVSPDRRPLRVRWAQQLALRLWLVVLLAVLAALSMASPAMAERMRVGA